MDIRSLDDDPIAIYRREVCTTPALTRDEDIRLSQQVLAHGQQAEAAGKRLVDANLALVVSIAEEYGVRVLDLIQAGNDGLVRALETLSDNPDVSFATHAAACIRKAIEEMR